jgi:hypothetical protein
MERERRSGGVDSGFFKPAELSASAARKEMVSVGVKSDQCPVCIPHRTAKNAQQLQIDKKKKTKVRSAYGARLSKTRGCGAGTLRSLNIASSLVFEPATDIQSKFGGIA